MWLLENQEPIILTVHIFALAFQAISLMFLVVGASGLAPYTFRRSANRKFLWVLLSINLCGFLGDLLSNVITLTGGSYADRLCDAGIKMMFMFLSLTKFFTSVFLLLKAGALADDISRSWSFLITKYATGVSFLVLWLTTATSYGQITTGLDSTKTYCGPFFQPIVAIVASLLDILINVSCLALFIVPLRKHLNDVKSIAKISANDNAVENVVLTTMKIGIITNSTSLLVALLIILSSGSPQWFSLAALGIPLDHCVNLGCLLYSIRNAWDGLRILPKGSSGDKRASSVAAKMEAIAGHGKEQV